MKLANEISELLEGMNTKISKEMNRQQSLVKKYHEQGNHVLANKHQKLAKKLLKKMRGE